MCKPTIPTDTVRLAAIEHFLTSHGATLHTDDGGRIVVAGADGAELAGGDTLADAVDQLITSGPDSAHAH